MESFFRNSDPSAETLFIGAAEGRHIGRSAPSGKCGKDVVNPDPGQNTRQQRRKGLSTGFPCLSRLGQIDPGEHSRNERRDHHAASLRSSARPSPEKTRAAQKKDANRRLSWLVTKTSKSCFCISTMILRSRRRPWRRPADLLH